MAYDSTNPVILELQAPTGLPRSSQLSTVTDPLSTTQRASDRMRHFYPDLYDLSPESHLSRFVKVLLGDAGIGGLSKQFAVARQQSLLLTTRYNDLDRFYGAALGFRRMSSETLDISPYTADATPEQWDLMDARDAAYRARIEAFARSLPLGGTPAGMVALAESVLGSKCRITETYTLIDEGNTANPGGAPAPAGARTYGDVEKDFGYYTQADRGSYADIEGGHGTFGRTTTSNRSEFIITPLRQITAEEDYEVTRVLSRFKPANSLLTVTSTGLELHLPVTLRQVYADSTYWEVSTKVAPATPAVSSAYKVVNADQSAAIQPRPAFSGYQGEAWSYNGDVASTVSYSEHADGTLKDKYNYQRVIQAGRWVDYTPDKALTSQTRLLLGRSVSDGVLVSAPYAGDRVGGLK